MAILKCLTRVLEIFMVKVTLKGAIRYISSTDNLVHYFQSLYGASGIRDILISYDIDLVLGDFNINFFNLDQIKPLKTLMVLYITFKWYKVLRLYLLEVCLTMFMFMQPLPYY